MPSKHCLPLLFKLGKAEPGTRTFRCSTCTYSHALDCCLLWIGAWTMFFQVVPVQTHTLTHSPCTRRHTHTHTPTHTHTHTHTHTQYTHTRHTHMHTHTDTHTHTHNHTHSFHSGDRAGSPHKISPSPHVGCCITQIIEYVCFS